MFNTMLIWNRNKASWQPSDPLPEGPDGADVALFETLRSGASAYALALHQRRIAASWMMLTGHPLAQASLPTVVDAGQIAAGRGWYAVRYELRRYGGQADVRLRGRERVAFTPPVRLLPVELDVAAAAYPHKSLDRDALTQAYQRAIAVHADDALICVGTHIREAARAFAGLVTEEALVLPPLAAQILPSTTRTAAVEWCADRGLRVIERAITLDECKSSALVYGNAVMGLQPAVIAGSEAIATPRWLDLETIRRRLTASG